MTPTDLATAAVAAWITHRAPSFDSLDGIPIRTVGTDDEHVGLQIVVSHEAPEEHPILKGVLTIPMMVEIGSVPGEEADTATPQADHQEVAGDLYDIIADRDGITFCDAYQNLRCFDILGTAPATSGDDGRRVTAFGFTMVACLRTS